MRCYLKGTKYEIGSVMTSSKFLVVFVLFALIFVFMFSCDGFAQTGPILEKVNPPYGPPGTIIKLEGAQLVLQQPDRGNPEISICGIPTRIIRVSQAGDVFVTAPDTWTGINHRCDISITNDAGFSDLKNAYTCYDPPELAITDRNFKMGFVPILLKPSDDPVLISWYWEDARQIAVDYGDVVSILNSVWSDCDGGVPHMADLSGTVSVIEWVHDHNTAVMVGLEITTGYRDNVGYCPGDDFSQQYVWDDFEAQVRFLFDSLDTDDYPEYLMLGIEMNMYYVARPDDWSNYIDLLAYLYSVVREYTDKTKIVVSFQFETMHVRGAFPLDQAYPRQWEIYADMALDVLGISSYQGAERIFCSYDPMWIAQDKFHYFTDPAYNPRALPIAITETGYPSTHNGNDFFHTFCGSKLHQHNFLVRLSEILNQQNAEFVIWWSLHEGALVELAEYFKSMRLVTKNRDCYPDCYPSESGCIAKCELRPEGSMAFETWNKLYKLPQVTFQGGN